MQFFCKVSRATQETSHMRNRSVQYFVKTPGITFLKADSRTTQSCLSAKIIQGTHLYV